MGCGQSKNQIGIAPKGGTAPGTAPGTPVLGTPTKGRLGPSRPNSKTIKVKGSADENDNTDLSIPVNDSGEDLDEGTPKNNRKRLLVKRGTWTSQDSLGTDVRGGSATSKFSQHSNDSGFGGDGNKRIVTEHSDALKVAEVEDDFESPRDLGSLGIVGKGCPQRLSAKDKDRMEEQRILAKLREEGFIHRPMSRASGGLAFEVVADTNKPEEFSDPFAIPSPRKPGHLPPVRLAKLEKRKKKKRTLTQEDIQAKLERADQRRKEQEQQRIEKIAQVANKSDVINALDAFAQAQKDKVVIVDQKVDQAAENREKRLKEMRDKLRAKQEHAEKVRKRKALVPADPSSKPPTGKRITEDTPVGVRQDPDHE